MLFFIKGKATEQISADQIGNKRHARIKEKVKTTASFCSTFGTKPASDKANPVTISITP